MKNIFLKPVLIAILAITGIAAKAQSTESKADIQKQIDSIKLLLKAHNIVLDSPKKAVPRKTIKLRDAATFRSQSSSLVHKKTSDSINTKLKLERDSMYRDARRKYVPKDSIAYANKLLKSQTKNYRDSIDRKIKVTQQSYDRDNKRYRDLMNRKFAYSDKRFDSLRNVKYKLVKDSMKLNKVRFKSLDSLQRSFKRMDSLTVRKSSLLSHRKFDSLRSQQYMRSLKTDSVKFKQYLIEQKEYLQKMYVDSVINGKNYKTKEVTIEMPYEPNTNIYIDNKYKKVIVKTGRLRRVKLTTTVNYTDEQAAPDAGMLKTLGITVTKDAKGISVIAMGKKIGTEKAGGEADNKTLNSASNIRRVVFIEVPQNAALFLTTQFADAEIENRIASLTADISNGTLKINDADVVNIKARYSKVKAANIKQADMTVNSGSFTANSIGQLTISSTFSTVKIDDAATTNITSTSDEYLLAKAGSITGNKDFGKLNIINLKDQLVLTGNNADININSLSTETPLIKINNKYADLKFPVYNLINYSIHYEGSSRDVNKILSSGAKSAPLAPGTPTALVPNTTGGGTVTTAASQTVNNAAGADSLTTAVNRTVFEAIGGDIKGKHTKVDIVCAFCNVSFN